MKPLPALSPLEACCGMAFALLLAGCTTNTYVVQVDAIAKPAATAGAAGPAGEPQPLSYQIRSTNPKLDEGSLRYKEVADYVRTALSGKGMYEAPRPEKADMIIDIDYGIDAPRVKFDTQSQPIYAETGGGVRMQDVAVPVIDPKTGQRFIVHETMAIPNPVQTRILGFEDVVRPVIVYEKYLKISARSNTEAVEGRAPPEVWSVNVSAEDESKELRKYLPILASATTDYIGTNTNQEKPVKLKADDDAVAFIKKGM
ncbi:MAG TPA: hypothetical protein VHD61_10805 [Lacunisphaera sp.]|nr:hypothetical protein [Lacunisphaera sp.]